MFHSEEWPISSYVPSAPAVATVKCFWGWALVLQTANRNYRHYHRDVNISPGTERKVHWEPVMTGQTYVTKLLMVPGRSEASQSPFLNDTWTWEPQCGAVHSCRSCVTTSSALGRLSHDRYAERQGHIQAVHTEHIHSAFSWCSLGLTIWRNLRRGSLILRT